MDANLLHVLLTRDKRNTDHFVAWRLHCTLTLTHTGVLKSP